MPVHFMCYVSTKPPFWPVWAFLYYHWFQLLLDTLLVLSCGNCSNLFLVPTFNSDWHVHLYIPYMFVACFWNYAAGINEIGCYLLHIPWFRAPQVTWSSLDKNWWNQKGGVSYHSTHGELLFSCWQLHHVGDTVDGSEIPNTHLGGMKPCD